jgi:hypothetical protein
MWWPTLEAPIDEWLSKAKNQPNRITERQILTEILGSVREISRRLDQTSRTQIFDVDRTRLLDAIPQISPEAQLSPEARSAVAAVTRELLNQWTSDRMVLRGGRHLDKDSPPA